MIQINVKILNKIEAHKIKHYIKRIAGHYEFGLSQGCKDGSLSTNQSMYNHIQKQKDKNHITILVEKPSSF